MKKKLTSTDFKKLAEQAAAIKEKSEQKSKEMLDEALKDYFDNLFEADDEELEVDAEDELTPDEEEEIEEEVAPEAEDDDEELEFDVEDDEVVEEEDPELDFDVEDDEELEFDIEDDEVVEEEDPELDFDLEDDEMSDDEELDFDLEDDEDEEDSYEMESKLVRKASKTLEEAKVIDARVRAITLIRSKYNVSESTFRKLLGRFDNARTVEDVKFVYNLTKENLTPKKAVNKKRMQSASKMIESKFARDNKKEKQVIDENIRVKKLAGILD